MIASAATGASAATTETHPPPFAVRDGGACLHALAPVLQRIALPSASVTVHVRAHVPPLPFPTEILERITLNLVRNAAEALVAYPPRQRAGEIVVALRATDAHLELIVEDNGPGLDPVAAARLVTGPALRRADGRGLGHGIVRDLARRSGAGIEVRVATGRGTRVTLRWPFAVDAQPLRRGTPERSVAC